MYVDVEEDMSVCVFNVFECACMSVFVIVCLEVRMEECNFGCMYVCMNICMYLRM